MSNKKQTPKVQSPEELMLDMGQESALQISLIREQWKLIHKDRDANGFPVEVYQTGDHGHIFSITKDHHGNETRLTFVGKIDQATGQFYSYGQAKKAESSSKKKATKQASANTGGD